jgi:hypothetical protein
LVKALPSKIIIVGGPGNSMERNCYYSVENDLNVIEERGIKHWYAISQPL